MADRGPAVGAPPVELAAAAASAAQAAATAAGVVVREMSTLPDLRAVYELYDRIWQPAPDRVPVSMEVLRALTHAGNYTAGAYRGAELVGASVAFFAAPPGQALHSHVAGVASRGRGTGYALKLHQRAWALARSLRVVTWTFDPLVARNAYFNLAKLAALPTGYLVDFYGELSDGINAGQGSDRLLVRWELGAPAVTAACAGRPAASGAGSVGARPALAVSPQGEPRPGTGYGSAATVSVAVPVDIEQLRRESPPLARAWRMAVRETLGELMTAGGRVTGFTRTAGYIVDRSGK